MFMYYSMCRQRKNNLKYKLQVDGSTQICSGNSSSNSSSGSSNRTLKDNSLELNENTVQPISQTEPPPIEQTSFCEDLIAMYLRISVCFLLY